MKRLTWVEMVVLVVIGFLVGVYAASFYVPKCMLYTCEQAQLETYERRTIDGREEQCMPDGRVWRLPGGER